MTATAEPIRHASGDADRTRTAETVERLWALVDEEFLTEAGWDRDLQVLAPPPEHPTLGYRVCVVVGCQTISSRRNGLCAHCALRLQASDLDFDAFVAAGPLRQWMAGEFTCDVDGCERPRRTNRSRLCDVHHAKHRKLGGPSLEVFLARPDVRGLPSLGPCRVAACNRRSTGSKRLCRQHGARWRAHLRQHPNADLVAWSRQAGPLSDGRVVMLGGLPPLVLAELCYGLQQRCRHGWRTRLWELRRLCNALRAVGAASVAELPDAAGPARRSWIGLARSIEAEVVCGLTPPEVERRKDVWTMAVFGHRATVDFTGVSQPWLREAVKEWVAEDLPSRRGNGVTGTVRSYVQAIGHLSASLRVQRDDQGMVVSQLGRADIVAFTNRLHHLEATGALSANKRIVVCRMVAKVLRDCRGIGLTRLGRPLAGLADDFALLPGDIPPAPDDDGAGRVLPEEVLQQLMAALPQLEASFNQEVRVAVRLLMDTGRRPDEICALPWDCLERGADGKHVLVYTNYKANRLDRRLPIGDATAEVIREQQQAVRSRFPSTPLGDLVLLPRIRRNPHGIRPVGDDYVSSLHRLWVDALPPLRLADGSEFNKANVFPYVYRHSYAQRHADAGTPVDVLCELMDHRSLDTTRGHYRSPRSAPAPRSTSWSPISSTGTASGSGGRRSGCWTTSISGCGLGRSRCRSGPAPSRPTSWPAAAPARSGSAAPAVRTFAPTRPTCRSCAATWTGCWPTGSGSALRSSWTTGRVPRRCRRRPRSAGSGR
jgi:integrase